MILPKIVVGNFYSRIYGIIPENIVNALKMSLKYTIQDYKHVVDAVQKGIVASDFDGTVYLYWPSKGHTFYTGMMSDVLKILDSFEFKYIIEDRRPIPPKNLPDMKLILPPGKYERPYQNVVVASMIKTTRGVMQAATGSGKTMMTTKIIGTIKSGPFLFFVPTVDLLEQAHSCLSECLTVPIGMIGDNKFDVRDINVMMIQTSVQAIKRNDPKFNIKDYKFDDDDDWDVDPVDETKASIIDNLIRNAAGVYLDEVHHASSKTCQTIMEACASAYWRYGGSATPFREDGAEKMIQALFGKVIMNISASWLIRNKYLVKPYIFNIKMSGLHGEWNSYPKVYKHYIVENDELNQLVAKLTIRMRQFNIPTLILVQQYPQGNAIQKLIPDAPFIRGDMARGKRRDAIASMRDGSVPCAIATTLADEGLDVERLGCVIVAGGGKSITRVYQRVGRALRSFKDKERAIIFLFSHEAPFLSTHGRRVANILKSESEFVIINTNEHRVMDDLNDLLCPGNVGIFGE